MPALAPTECRRCGLKARSTVATGRAFSTLSFGGGLRGGQTTEGDGLSYWRFADAAEEVPTLLVRVALTDRMAVLLPVTVNGWVNVNWLP